MEIAPSVETFLRKTTIPLRLACTTESGWPFVLSLWYRYENGQLFCATHEKARVVAYLRQEPRCAFEVAADDPPYCGLRGQARATIDPSRGISVLEQLLHRYLGGTENDLGRRLLARQEEEVAIVLTPVTLFTWDFSERMAAFASGSPKRCP